MATELHASAKAGGTEVALKIFAGYSHGGVLFAAPADYWDAVVAFVLDVALQDGKEG